MYLLIAIAYKITNFRSYQMNIWSKILCGNEYTARSQPDNRDIWIAGGWITKAQLYLQFTVLEPLTVGTCLRAVLFICKTSGGGGGGVLGSNIKNSL